jgi:ferredoxin
MDDAPAEPVRVRAFPGLCQGRGLCTRFAPEVYHLDAEGYLDLHILEVPPEHAAAARLGATVCPEHAVTVLDAVPATDSAT